MGKRAADTGCSRALKRIYSVPALATPARKTMFHMTLNEPLRIYRRVLAEWLLLLGALMSLGGYLGYLQYQDYKHTEVQEREHLASQAAVIEKNVVPQLLLASRVIEGILNDLPAWRAKNDAFKHANRQLRLINDAMIGIRPLLVIQADGTVIASSNEKLVGMNFAYREYFQTALNDSDPKTLHVGAPFKTVLNDVAISLSRIISGPNEKFAGIVIVGLAPEYFSILLDSVRYVPDMRTSIAHGDGKLFLTLPQNSKTNGTDLARPGSFFTRHRESAQSANVFTGTTYATGDERMMALRTIQLTTPAMDKPLVVAASRDLPTLFVPWRKNLFVQSILLGVMALFSTIGLLFTQRRRRDQINERDQAERRIKELLGEQRLMFDNAHVGIVMLNRRQVIKCNQRQAEIFGYAGPEEIEGRTTEMFYCSPEQFKALGEQLLPQHGATWLCPDRDRGMPAGRNAYLGHDDRAPARYYGGARRVDLGVYRYHRTSSGRDRAADCRYRLRGAGGHDDYRSTRRYPARQSGFYRHHRL